MLELVVIAFTNREMNLLIPNCFYEIKYYWNFLSFC